MPARFKLPDGLMPSAPAAPTAGPPVPLAAEAMLAGNGGAGLPALLEALAGAGLPAWLAAAREKWHAGAQDDAEAIARAAVQAFGGQAEAVVEYAAVLRARGKPAPADAVLRTRADQIAVALVLAGVLRNRGEFDAACQLVIKGLHGKPVEPDLYLQGCLFLEGSGRQDLAFECFEQRITAGHTSADDFANAARLATQVGQFELARKRYEQALAAGLDPGRWKVAEALATCQRYTDAGHPDIALFEEWSQRPDLDPGARAGILFALGKANDDLAHYSAAANCWRKANALVWGDTRWDAEGWQTLVGSQLAASWAKVENPQRDWVPVFVVGMPRSGTTLVAELLASRAGVRNRGELMFIPQLSTQITQQATEQDPASLAEAAGYYRRMLVRDDPPARWYIDKQTLNFQHLGLIAALFPQAQVVYCTRDPRDTAVSIWAQHFGADAARFIYDLDAIADVTRGCRQLMAHWRNSLPIPIHAVVYEDLVADPEQVIGRLCDAMGMGSSDGDGDAGTSPASSSAINTASMWQVRQPISSRAVGRWRNYADFMPELTTKFADIPMS